MKNHHGAFRECAKSRWVKRKNCGVLFVVHVCEIFISLWSLIWRLVSCGFVRNVRVRWC